MDQHDLNITNVKYDKKSSSIKIDEDTFIFYAHPNELLEEHLLKTLKVFKDIVDENILKNFHEKLSNEKSINLSYDEFKNIIYDAVIFHDYGKLSFKFQKKLNKNYHISGQPQIEFLKKHDIGLLKDLDSYHSFESSLLFLSKYLNIDDSNRVLILILSYIILGHHTNLKDINEELDFTYRFSDKEKENTYITTYYLLLNYLNIPTNLEKYTIINLQDFQNKAANKINNLKSGTFAFLYSYLYSSLITSDVIASSKSNKNLDDENSFKNIDNRISDELLEKMTETFYSIPYNANWSEKIENISSINDLRVKMLQEASLNINHLLSSNNDNKVFFLNMPTGAGKTNTSMKLALDLITEKKVNRIIYAMPFVNIIEQNYDVIKDNFKLNENNFEIRKIYSGTESIVSDDNEEFKSQLILQDQLFNFPVSCTTFVTLFNSLIWSNKKNKYMLNSLSNSVIILDEIQSLPIANWNSLYYLINELAINYNIYFIIMSATIPSFDKLKLDVASTLKYPKLNLIKDPNFYFNHDLFNRTEIKDYTILDLELKDYIEEYYLKKIKHNF